VSDPKGKDSRRTGEDTPEPHDPAQADVGGTGDDDRRTGEDSLKTPPAPADTAGGGDEIIEDIPAPRLADPDTPQGGGGGGGGGGDNGGDNNEDGTIEDFPSPVLAAYDPTEDREKIRGTIALILVLALVGVLVFAVVSSWIVMNTENRDALMKVLEVVLAPLVALVGAVTGFYYGEKSK